MSKEPYNEPAFPVPGGIHEHQFIGMTLRDYFAAKAMQSLVQQRCYPHDQSVGQYAYMIADAMLKARAA